MRVLEECEDTVQGESRGRQAGGWRVLSSEAPNCRKSGTALCFLSVSLELGSHTWLRASSLLPLGMPETWDHGRERPCSSGTDPNMGGSFLPPLPSTMGPNRFADHSGLIWRHG